MDASQKLGEKLIQGWTMLGDSCATCNCPLMRSRDGTRTICVACDDSKKPESSISDPIEAPAKTASSFVEYSSISPADVPQGYSSPEYVPSEATRTVDEALLESLDTALGGAKSADVFIEVLEAALKPLKSISISKESDTVKTLVKSINQKIQAVTTKPCASTNPQTAIAHFEAIDQLLKVSKEFDHLTK